MATWTQPGVSDTYANVISYLQARADSQAKMFDDGVTWTSLPTDAIRWNTSNSRFEKWNGSAWANLSTALTDVAKTANNLSDLASAATARTNLGLGTMAVVNSPVPVANGGSGATTAAGARTAFALSSADAVTFSTVTLGTTATVLVGTSDGSDTGSMFLGHSGVTRGAYLATYGNEHASLASKVVLSTGNVSGAHLDLVVNNSTGLLKFWTNNTLRGYYDASGHLVPSASATYDLGSGSLRYSHIYVSDSISILKAAGDAVISLESTGSTAYDQAVKFIDSGNTWWIGNRYTTPVSGWGIGRDSNKNDLYLDQDGKLAIFYNTAMADGDMVIAHINPWVHEGNNLLWFKVKYSTGTIKSGSVSLS